MNRRGFLGSILLAATAPAIVRADSLMRIVPLETLIYRRPIPFGREVFIAGGSIDTVILPPLQAGQRIVIHNTGAGMLSVVGHEMLDPQKTLDFMQLGA